MRTVELDAQGQVLGRLAVRVALALRGKDQPSYRPDRLADVQVIVKHADRFVLTGSKANQKMYYHFSGYPGGLKRTKVAKMKRDRMLWLAVRRMLPNNRLRAKMLKHLTLDLS